MAQLDATHSRQSSLATRTDLLIRQRYSRPSIQLSNHFLPAAMSISIDNPLIFVYPKSLTASQQSQSALPSNGPSPPPQTSSTRNSPSSLFPYFRPQLPSDHQEIPSDSQIAHSSPHELDSRSTILSGSLILKFSKPKQIKKIIISLCGQSYIGFNDRPYEYQKILDKDLEINLAAQLFNSDNQCPNPGNVRYNSQHNTYILDKGNYRFHWSFILPPDLPPYERGQFGFTTHKVVAKVKLGSDLGLGFKSVGKKLPSIIFGHGGHEIETESYFVAITYPSGNNDDTGDNLGLNMNILEQSEHLGPYTLSASSCYFTVAGLLSFKFKLTGIPQRKKLIKIYKITCLIKQQYRLISMKDKDSRTGGPAESWPPCQRRRVFVLDHSNVPNVKVAPSNGRALNPSEQLPYGSHGVAASTLGAESRHQPPCAASLSRTVASSQGRSRSHSRSRPQLRGFLRNRTRSRDDRNLEVPHQSNHPMSSWKNFSSMRLGVRRAQSFRRDTEETNQDSPLYSCRSPSGLGSTLSLSSHINQNHPNSATTFPRDDATAPLPQSYSSESHGFAQCNTNLDVARNSQDSGGSSSRRVSSGASHAVQGSVETCETRAVSMEQSSGLSATNAPRRGRQEEIPNTSSHNPRRNQNGNNHGGSKWRPGKRPNPHPSHVDPEVPLVTLTDEHNSWEIEHMGRLPTDDVIRPSTNPGTQTNIHIFHALLFEISYSVEDDTSSEASQSGTCSSKPSSCPSPRLTKKVLSIRKPVQISSCCCMAESMVLPPYSKLDPNAEIVQHPTPSHAARMLQCVCDTPTDVLMKTQNPKNPQPNSNANRPISNDNTSTPVTNSTLTFRSSNSSVDRSYNDRGSNLIHVSQNRGIDNSNNSFISHK